MAVLDDMHGRRSLECFCRTELGSSATLARGSCRSSSRDRELTCSCGIAMTVQHHGLLSLGVVAASGISRAKIRPRAKRQTLAGFGG